MLTHQEKLRLEKELLGLYISGHPLDPLKVLSTIKTPINALTDAHPDKSSLLRVFSRNADESQHETIAKCVVVS